MTTAKDALDIRPCLAGWSAADRRGGSRSSIIGVGAHEEAER